MSKLSNIEILIVIAAIIVAVIVLVYHFGGAVVNKQAINTKENGIGTDIPEDRMTDKIYAGTGVMRVGQKPSLIAYQRNGVYYKIVWGNGIVASWTGIQITQKEYNNIKQSQLMIQ